MIELGSFDHHFFKHNGVLIIKSKLAGRNVFHLKNPFLTKETPLDRKNLWYDPMRFEREGGMEAHSGSQTPLNLITKESPPLSYIINEKPGGYAVDIVREILHRENHIDSIQVLEWAEGYEKVLNEPNVALFSMERTIQRDPLFKWVGPLLKIRNVFIR